MGKIHSSAYECRSIGKVETVLRELKVQRRGRFLAVSSCPCICTCIYRIHDNNALDRRIKRHLDPYIIFLQTALQLRQQSNKYSNINWHLFNGLLLKTTVEARTQLIGISWNLWKLAFFCSIKTKGDFQKTKDVTERDRNFSGGTKNAST